MSVQKEKLVLIKYKNKYDRVRMSNFSKNIGESLKLNVWRFTNGTNLTPISDLIVDSIGESTHHLRDLYKIFLSHASDIAPYFDQKELQTLNEIKDFINRSQDVEPKQKQLITLKTKYQELSKKYEDLKKRVE